MKNIIYTILFLVYALHIHGQTLKINGTLEDWPEAAMAYEEIGDVASTIDIKNIFLSHNTDFLFIGFELSEEIIIQYESDFVVIIDADNNPNTGFPLEGLGSEFSFYFDNNSGFINSNNQSTSIQHDDVDFYVAPAYSSKFFELAIHRSLGGFGPVLDGQISIAIVNDIFGGDILPGSNNGVTYDFNNGIEIETPEPIITKPESADFRILSYNVLQDQVMEQGLFDEYQRLFQAIQPDIIAFQEIYDNSSTQVKNRVQAFLSDNPDQVWYHDKIGSDIILVSKYPILFDAWVDGNGAFVLDVDGREVMIFNVHFPCCDNDNQRDQEIDALLSYARNIQNGTGEYALQENAPILIVGDYNLVGNGAQIERLLSGDIKNNPAFGPDFNPDWGNGPFVDAIPLVNNTNLSYTWHNQFSGYTGGRLDFTLFTPSSISLSNSLVLDTRQMTQGQLFLNNLSETDCIDASDHLPLISDWNFGEIATPLFVENIVNPVDCFGGNTGSIQLIATGGTAPYMYQLDNGLPTTDGIFTDLVAKTYLAKVIDSEGQTFETFIVLDQNPELIVAIDQIDNYIEIDVQGGVEPYLCSIDNGQSFSEVCIYENLPNGNYTVIVSDALGCSKESEFTVFMNETADLNTSILSVYPNPFIEYIVLKSDTDLQSLVLLNSAGELFRDIPVPINGAEQIIDLSDLKVGLYILEVTTKQGNRCYKQLIKH